MNNWLNGIMGVIVGDALGCPVQFMSREEIRERGLVTGMEGHGTYNMPAGTWTDDGSMTLAALDSIRELGYIDLEDIMVRFVNWYEGGEYTQYGEAFDMGNTCSMAIENYEANHDVYTCGGTLAHTNGNGSLMRIMPACLYACANKLSSDEAIKIVHEVSGLTHNHLRSRIACGLYYFCVKAILSGSGTVRERVQSGINHGFSFYENDFVNMTELAYYGRLRDTESFVTVDESKIKSSGYVVDSMEAAIWCLVTTDIFVDCVLKAVNLGDDTDTVAAIAGGLAGLYYGFDSIPQEWLDTIEKLDYVTNMCEDVNAQTKR